jgi:hypothetical protein
MWNGLATRLGGEIVVLEPLAAAHEEGLWAAAQHPEIWTWTTPVGESCDARNERSRAALAALPAQFEGVFRRHMLTVNVGVRDSAYYSITDEEWPGVRANLVRRLAAARARPAAGG